MNALAASSASTVGPLVIAAPLGVLFRDVATSRIVDDDLDVEATLVGRPSSPITLVPNRSGVYVLPRLPGRPQSVLDDHGEVAMRAVRRIRLTVSTRHGRYVPWSCEIDVPHRGLLGLVDLASSSPPESPPATGQPPGKWLPLFPAPGAPVHGGMAVARADVVDDHDEPAPNAIVEIVPPGPAAEVKTWIGVADAAGRVVVQFPWPAPALVASPPGVTTGPLSEEKWVVSVRVRYRPPSGPSGPLSASPDLNALLSQPLIVALATVSPPTQLEHADLHYGRDLVLATDGRRDGALVVQP